MKQLEFETEINAAPEKVWETMWSAENYGKWTPGHRYEGNWETGSEMRFFDKDNNGMYNRVETHIPNRELKMKHLGWIMAGKLDPQNWTDSEVTYFFEPTENGTLLKTEINALDEFVEFYNNYIPNIFTKIKELSEN